MIKSTKKYSETLNISQLRYLSKIDLINKYYIKNPFLYPRLRYINLSISGTDFLKKNPNFNQQNTDIKCFSQLFLLSLAAPHITLEKMKDTFNTLKKNELMETFRKFVCITNKKKIVYFLIELIQNNSQLLAKLKLTKFFNIKTNNNKITECSVNLSSFNFINFKEFYTLYLNQDNFKNTDFELTFGLENLHKNSKKKKEFLTLFKQLINIG